MSNKIQKIYVIFERLVKIGNLGKYELLKLLSNDPEN